MGVKKKKFHNSISVYPKYNIKFLKKNFKKAKAVDSLKWPLPLFLSFCSDKHIKWAAGLFCVHDGQKCLPQTHFLPCPLNEDNYGSCKRDNTEEIAP